ncbi:MAG: hypothetical protein M3N30_07730 [Bacteroidota bacterium]|nr:hypothetical protein [Bacteroidota bacterium]
MKTGLLPVLNLMFSILAVMLCFIPIILYWRKRMAPEKSFLVVALFWTINGITYIPEIFNWQWYNSITNQITQVYNLIDAPLIIIFFYYFFKNPVFRYLLFFFIFFEAVIIAWKGFTLNADTIIIGLGSFISLVLNVWSISNYLRKVKHSASENVMVFVNAGFIFYYGLFTVIYIFNYVNFSPVTLPYLKFINYFIICIATGLISFGIYKHAVRQLSEERF